MVVGIFLKQQAENERLLQEARKVMNQQSALLEKKLEVKEQTAKEDQAKEIQAKKEDKPQHNSLQHDPTVSVPLLSLLVDALKKEKKEGTQGKDGEETLETITGDSETETKKESKDAIVALADRIKRLYANEMMQQAYTAAQGNYTGLARYQNEAGVQVSNVYKATYQQDDYGAAQKNEELEKKRSESSTYSKLAGGDKPMAFIMTDPRGRLHSTWEIVRVLNETADGKIERNDGLHYQGLS
ncbi:hypothetical protein HZC31_05625 [Candidatus Woesearchaeota archaeon]|nr:hypothetical protein [Candidatus Woesearchaeota archaeon]